MLRMALAPCAPFNVTTELMVKAARLARQYPGVRLHTHLAENQEDIDFSQKEYNCRPGAYIKSVLTTQAQPQQMSDACCAAHAGRDSRMCTLATQYAAHHSHVEPG